MGIILHRAHCNEPPIACHPPSPLQALARLSSPDDPQNLPNLQRIATSSCVGLGIVPSHHHHHPADDGGDAVADKEDTGPAVVHRIQGRHSLVRHTPEEVAEAPTVPEEGEAAGDHSLAVQADCNSRRRGLEKIRSLHLGTAGCSLYGLGHSRSLYSAVAEESWTEAFCRLHPLS